MVDSPRDALELFGSAPVDALAIGPFLVRRPMTVPGSMAAELRLRRRHPDHRSRRPGRPGQPAADGRARAPVHRRGRRPPRAAIAAAAARRRQPPCASSAPAAGARRQPATPAGAPPTADLDRLPRRRRACWTPTGARHWLERSGRAAARTVGVQGRLRVPLPAGRDPPTRSGARPVWSGRRWITADMAYRRAALEATGGFDERFPRAFREDSDLALRIDARRLRHRLGASASTTHPVAPGRLARQHQGAGRQHGQRAAAGQVRPRLARGDRRRAGSYWSACTRRRGRAAAAGSALRAGRRRLAAARRRSLGGGHGRVRRAPDRAGPGNAGRGRHDGRHQRRHPAGGDWHSAVRGAAGATARVTAAGARRPAGCAVRPRRDADARRALQRPTRRWSNPCRAPARRCGTARRRRPGRSGQQPVGSRPRLAHRPAGGRGERAGREMLGPFDTWRVCPHGEEDGCPCRKPGPGMVQAAARELGVQPADCVVSATSEPTSRRR